MLPWPLRQPRTLATLLAQGATQWGWWDARDRATLFQNRSGLLTPVTAPGQSVGTWLDKAGGVGPDLQINKGTAPAQVGTPGVMPSGWGARPSSNGIGREVVAVGPDFVDVRYVGTAAASTEIVVTNGFAPRFTVVGDVPYEIAFSAIEVVAGALPLGVVFGYRVVWFQAGSFLGGANASEWLMRCLLPPSADALELQTRLNGAIAGMAFDVTLRLRAPQSVRRILGQHRTAISDPARGIWGEAGGLTGVLFDGVNTAYQTPVWAPGADKVLYIGAIRKLSDASQGVVVELSQDSLSTNNTFALFAPNATGVAGYFWRSRSTQQADLIVTAGHPAPVSTVIVGLGDLAVSSSTLRLNSAAFSIGPRTPGGPYGAERLFTGARGGTTGFFDGLISQDLVRFGPALPSGAAIAAAERMMGIQW